MTNNSNCTNELDVTTEFIDNIYKILDICSKNNTNTINFDLDTGRAVLNVELKFTLADIT